VATLEKQRQLNSSESHFLEASQHHLLSLTALQVHIKSLITSTAIIESWLTMPKSHVPHHCDLTSKHPRPRK
jgi:hypothetical protein